MSQIAPYGTWRSPVSAREVAEAVELGPVVFAEDATVWWQEMRPGEDGRSYLMRRSPSGETTEAPAPDGASHWLPRLLDMAAVFFTSRGLGAADIDCRGSSGYGRSYREHVYGEQDAVVPTSQATLLQDALRRNRVPHACLIFDGEGHVLRRATTIRRALEAELSFYGQVLGFEPAESSRLAMDDGSVSIGRDK